MALKNREKSESEMPVKRLKRHRPALKFTTRLMTPLRFGIAAGAIAVLGGIYSDSGAPTLRPLNTNFKNCKEAISQNEMVLGNVRFYFKESQPDDLCEQKILLESLGMAYEKLRGFLGDEVMNMPEPMDCPIVMDRALNDANAKVQWKDLELRLQQGVGEPFIVRLPSEVSLVIKKYTEGILAHELVHLYAQPTGFWSEAFHEGQASAIQDILYPLDAADKRLEAIASDSRVISMLSGGMDYNAYDKDQLMGGIQNEDLHRLLYMRWSVEWRDLHAKYPTFLRDFYTEIARQRRSGKDNFFKSDLLAISKNVLPEFELSYEEKMKSMHELGKKKTDKQFVAMRIESTGTLVIANYETHARDIGFSLTTPPYMSPVVPELFRVFYFDFSTQKEESYFPAESIDPHFALVNLPVHVLGTPRLRIMIGDRQVPLAD